MSTYSKHLSFHSKLSFWNKSDHITYLHKNFWCSYLLGPRKSPRIPNMTYEPYLLFQPHFPSPVLKHPLLQLLQITYHFPNTLSSLHASALSLLRTPFPLFYACWPLRELWRITSNGTSGKLSLTPPGVMSLCCPVSRLPCFPPC